LGGWGGEVEEVGGERVARALEGYGERFVQLGGAGMGDAGGRAGEGVVYPAARGAGERQV